MNKILITGYFKNCDLNEEIIYKQEGNLIKDTISFINNDTIIKLVLKKETIFFSKENKLTKLIYEFKEKKHTLGKYFIKSENIKIDIPIYTIKILNKKQEIRIEYKNADSKENNILNIEYEVLK